MANGKSNNKKKSPKRGTAKPLLLALVILFGLVASFFGGSFLTDRGYISLDLKNLFSGGSSLQKNDVYDPDKLSVYFLDVGQGDSALVMCPDGTCMLIDGGTNAGADKLIGDLQRLGVSKIKYFVLTHPHEDHVGGADEVINTFSVESVILPDVGAATKTWTNVVNAIEDRGCREIVASPGNSYTVSEGCSFTIYAPYDTDETLNNCSVVLRMSYGETSFLFTGDAEKEAEGYILEKRKPEELKADVLKVGHHGSSTSSSEAFLDAVSPSISVISCGKNNTYGHPHTSTLSALTAKGSQIYRTDENGSVLVQSDGRFLTVIYEK